MDDAIVIILKEYNLMIGERTAEQIKITIGSATAEQIKNPWTSEVEIW